MNAHVVAYPEVDWNAFADTFVAEVLGLSTKDQAIEIRRRVGYVAERPTLYEWMTVSEIGWFAAGFYGDGFVEPLSLRTN